LITSLANNVVVVLFIPGAVAAQIVAVAAVGIVAAIAGKASESRFRVQGADKQ